jgi:hypothetical protein
MDEGAFKSANMVAMRTKSLEILEKAQLPSAQARAILQVMETELATDTLATKADLQALATKADLEAFATKIELLTFKSDLEVKIALVRAEISASESRVIRWVVTSFLGQAAVILGALYFAVTHLRQ